MECPICGHKLGENDAFCSNCGNFALPLRDSSVQPSSADETPSHPHKVAERLYPPPETDMGAFEDAGGDSSVSHSASARSAGSSAASTGLRSSSPPPSQKSAGRGLKVFSTICCILMAAAVGAAVYISVTSSSLRVQLRMAQRDNSTAQADIENLESQVSSLSESLESAVQENTTLGSQVAQLQSQVSELESSVNQTTYDKESAERQLEEKSAQLDAAAAENSDLSADLTETQNALYSAQTENETLAAENDSLRSTISTYETELDFFDTYVVFVMLSSSDKYYHKYSCSEFTKKNFLAYSVRLAEANGYTPCPICFGAASESESAAAAEPDADT